MITPRATRLIPLVLGILAGLSTIWVCALAARANDRIMWLCAAWFGLGTAVFLWGAIRPSIVIQIGSGRIRAGGVQYKLDELASAKVVRYGTTRGIVRCLQIRLRNPPRRSRLRQVLHCLHRIGVPKYDLDGVPLEAEPSIMIDIPLTGIPDSELNALLASSLGSEQAGAGQPATCPVDEPEGGDKPQPEAEGRSR
jgi:hypothetical protein